MCIYLIFKNKENFQSIGHYEYNIATFFEDTFFETSLKETFGDFNKLICNILPTSAKENCLADNINPYEINLFPVHILRVDINTFLAVFNNGYIYEKKNLTNDKFWKGPLVNSLPNNNVPLRMITLDPNKRLLGVGYNNKVYRKKELYENSNYTSRWEQVPNTDDTIYILYESGDKSTTSSITENDNLLALNKKGLIKKVKYNELGSSQFEVLANDLFPVSKIYFDKNGFLLGIGQDFSIYRKSSKQYEESVFDPTVKTETQVLDVIYDIDAKLYGLVFLPNIGIVELMKQNVVYYASKFLPLELSEYGLSKENKVSINDIIKFKTGVDFNRDLIEGTNNLTFEDVRSKLELQDMKELRQLCANRGYFGNITYHNFQFINELQNQKEKINDLNKIVKDLVEYDPDIRKIQ